MCVKKKKKNISSESLFPLYVSLCSNLTGDEDYGEDDDDDNEAQGGSGEDRGDTFTLPLNVDSDDKDAPPPPGHLCAPVGSARRDARRGE